jgi:hypothetical protein
MFVSGPETRCPSSKRNPSGRYHQQRAIALAQEAQYPARIVDQACEHEPPRMTIFPNGLRGLEQMFNLVRSVSGSLSSTSILRTRPPPRYSSPLIQAEIFLLLRHDIVERLVLMVQAVELFNTVGFSSYLTKFGFALPFLLASSPPGTGSR